MKSAPNIAFDYRPCRGIAIALCGVTLLAAIAAVLSGLDPLAKLLIAGIAVASGAAALHRHLAAKTVRIAHGAGGWVLVDREATETPVALIDHIGRGVLLVLGFRDEGGQTQRFVLTPTNCAADLRRRLILTLAAGPRRRPPIAGK